MVPKIFISSTIYDFRDLRSSLKFYFEKYDYEVQLSEFNDFKKKLDINSYQACLDSIETSDYFLLFIGSRVGGYFDKTADITITQKEYQTAYEKAKVGKLKLLVFVREDIWNIKTDRKSIEKFIKTEFIEAKEIDEKDVDKIIHHPSDFITDADKIFNFIDEVCRKEEMKTAIYKGGEYPKNNWVHPFKNFKDIIDVINNEFKLNSPIDELTLRRNLKNELVSNAQNLLRKHKGKISKSTDWAQYGRASISKELNNTSTMKYKYFKWLTMYAVTGPKNKTKIRYYFIEKAIASGLFLKFNISVNTFEDTDISNYLLTLRNKMSEFIYLSKIATEYSLKLTEKYEYLKTCPNETDVTLNNWDLFPFLCLCDCAEDIITLSKAFFNYLEGDSTAFDYVSLCPLSPFEGESIRLNDENLTAEETINWLKGYS